MKINVNIVVAKYRDRIALQVATKDKHLNIIKKLVQTKIDVNATTIKYRDRIAS